MAHGVAPPIPLLLSAVLLCLLSSLPSLAAAQSSSCLTSFSAVEAASPLLAFRSIAFACPAGCLQSLPSASPVWGSYPYAAPSSVCLAAVHCGVVNATLGGSVFVRLFYRQDWSGGDTQTVFPFGSAHGTSSNGVDSQDVPQGWYSLPSNGTEHSFTVQSRGELASQRRTAPFSPRSGHLHVAAPLFDPVPVRAPPPPRAYRSLHVIIGGETRGGKLTNDVWLAQPSSADQPSDVDWTALGPAPFSPRADMRSALQQKLDVHSGQVVYVIAVLGGRTANACGLRELGVCSDEVWALSLTLAPDSDVVVAANWSSGAFHLPVARCEPAVFQSLSGNWLFMAGGQQSASAQQACDAIAAPAVYNDVYRNNLLGSNMSAWDKLANAPFSPRRSQLLDETFIGQLHNTSSATTTDIQGPLSGGLSYLSFLPANGTQPARLQQLELYADVWACTALGSSGRLCHWGSGLSPAGPASPTSSVPLPTAAAANHPVRTVWPQAGPSVGGFSSQGAHAAWQQLAPLANVSVLLVRPAPDAQLSLYDVMAERQNVSLRWLLDLSELQDNGSEYRRGSAWIMAHSPWTLRPGSREAVSSNQLSLSTLHYQPASLSLSEGNASWFVPQAASCLNTTRPSFLFPSRRLGHSSDSWNNRIDDGQASFTIGQTVLSGGRSGDDFLSDWLLLHERRCLPPTDPSFSQLLGAVLLPLTGNDSASYDDGTMVDARCADGHHFEPPSDADWVSLTCAPNGLWLDSTALPSGIRRCVQTLLHCPAPLVARNELYCQPPLPQLLQLQIDGGQQAEDAVTLVNVKVQTQLVLIASGAWFSEPVSVTVGGHRCLPVLLVGDTTQLTYNASCSCCGSGELREVTDSFASQLTCSVPHLLLGIAMPVIINSGRSYSAAEVLDGAGSAHVATVSSTRPIITFLGSASCSKNMSLPNSLELFDCPNMNAFNISICAALASTGGLPLTVIVGVAEALPCTAFDLSRPLGFDPRPSVCAVCSVSPRLGLQQLRVQHVSLPLQSAEPASLSFMQCPPGYWTDFKAALNAGQAAVGPLCVRCPAGWSTLGMRGADSCSPCRAGYYSNHTGSADCAPCEPFSFSSQLNASECAPCPLNSHAESEASSLCEACLEGEYLLCSPDRRCSCALCPAGAHCHANGSITATYASFLIVDSGLPAQLEAVPCSPYSCVEVSGGSTTAAAPRLAVSALPVFNRCASGRMDAFVQDDRDAPQLRDTDGVNVLCAHCRPLHSQVAGHCILCSAVNWPALVGLLVACFAFVVLIHRLPHDWTGSARSLISAYYLQMFALYLSNQWLAQLLGLLNVDLFGVGVGGGLAADEASQSASALCILPLHGDVTRFVVSLLSPGLLFVLLGLLMLLHLAAHRGLQWLRPRWQHGHMADKLYCWLFVPAPPVLPAHLDQRSLRQPLLLQAEPEDSAVRPAARVSSPLQLLTYQRTCVRLLLLSYNSLTQTSLHFFHSQSVGRFGRRLVHFPEISPDSVEWRALLPLMLLMLSIAVVLLPLLLLCWLYRQHRLGALRRLAEAGSAAGPAQEGLSPSTALLMQLCSMYRAPYWWMAPATLIRRLLIIALFVWVDVRTLWACVTLVSYCLLALQLYLLPYQRPEDNAMEAVALLSLSLLSSAQTALSPDSTSPALRVVASALLLLPFLSPLANAGLKLGRRCLPCMQQPSVQHVPLQEPEL